MTIDCLSFQSPVATIRPFNTFGPRQSSRAVIPTIITQLIKGNDLYLGDLSTTRDFLYVKDTVQGFILSVENCEKIRGKTINLGTGQDVTIESIVRQLISKLNPKAKIHVDKRKLRPEQSEVRRLCAKISLAQEYLDWNPSYTLEQGLDETIQWIRDNIDLYTQLFPFQ